MKSEIWITIVCASLLFVAPASAQQGSYRILGLQPS